ncbi:adenosine kinase [Sphingomonas sp.]|uniref:adenosine kinase n=1 Tax=Sphingomonas sp. TaxID=28214 RepID=UPI003CC5AF1C
MDQPTYDIVAIGNAIVDVLATIDDAFLTREGLTKGQMQLIDQARAKSLYQEMGETQVTSGGSAANTLVGAAMLGARCRMIAQVADDQLGEIFVHDLRVQGVTCAVPPREPVVETGRCLVLVSEEDGERTMNTFLGAAQFLPPDAIDEAEIAGAKVLLLEGYLWDPAEPRAAMQRAIRIARAAGRKVALGVSATFCIMNHHADFTAMIDAGEIDILFANEEEAVALAGSADVETALAALAPKVPLLVVTHGARGASAIESGVRTDVAAEPVAKVVDTTGAGDLFAAGFLTGYVRGLPNAASLKLGAVCAAEVIGHVGARPVADLKALAGGLLG